MTRESEDHAGRSVVKSDLDPLQAQQLLERIRAAQNFGLGAAAGLVGAGLGAALWAVITVATGYQIGFMAIGIGFMVGWAVRRFGQGVDTRFGVLGGVLSLVGCVTGNLLTICGTIAAQAEMPFLSVLQQLDLNLAVNLMVETFSPMDLLFYGIAVWEGYKLSFRQVTEQDLQSMPGGSDRFVIRG